MYYFILVMVFMIKLHFVICWKFYDIVVRFVTVRYVI